VTTPRKEERWWSKALGVLLVVVLGLFMLWGLLASIGFELR
jgi:autotransporter translocation and assembly factor TamB